MANTYKKGGLVRCTGTFTDSSGDAIDPTSVFFSALSPGGTQTDYTYGTNAELVKSSTGVYYVDVNANASGDWYYRFYSTGSGQAANETRFVIQSSQF